MTTWFQILSAIAIPLLGILIGGYFKWLWEQDSIQDRGAALRDEFVGRQFGEGAALFEVHSISTQQIPPKGWKGKAKMWSPWHRELNGWTIVRIHSQKMPFTEMWEYMESGDFFDGETPVLKHEGTKPIGDFQTASDIWIKSVNSKDVRESLEEVPEYIRYVIKEVPLDAIKKQPF
ncbi:hypothetical protein A4G99_12530 [Haladaptatus sp. R4]|uniref:hypothetical protein n=1 Tax=Haladaptatus sp. R4 TaxID=1679489 RepID=UPI0007B49330|nr:hypothetical protein [Haladaptatus sp. R4]KZN23695.1 hypothetical protein A4G99_12530 [Haladaptatus sp. R4]